MIISSIDTKTKDSIDNLMISTKKIQLLLAVEVIFLIVFFLFSKYAFIEATTSAFITKSLLLELGIITNKKEVD